MFRAKNVDLLHGSIFKAIIAYAIPLILINLIQNLFNAVDIMVLSFVASDNAVASVGATSVIISLIVNSFFGLSGGAKIVISRLIGEGEESNVKKAVSTSMISALVVGVIVGIVGFIFASSFLHVTKCPTECFGGALIYMRIYVAAAPVIMIYNFGSSILNAAGDTQSPLYYMIISGVLNVVLNFILCLILPEKVAAVAIATVVSQLIGAILVVRRLCKMDGICHLDLKNITFNKKALGKILKNGIPLAISASLYPISNLQIQTAINSFGAASIAGNSASSTLHGLVTTVASTPWTTSTTVFVGQNLGAREDTRVKKSIAYLMIISVTISVVLGIVCTLFSKPLLSMFVSGDEAIKYAQRRFLYTNIPTFIATMGNILSHAIQAFGYSAFSSLNSIVCVLLFRAVWMNFIYARTPTFDVLMQCWPVSWTLTLIVTAVFFFYLYFAKFKKGKLKKML